MSKRRDWKTVEEVLDVMADLPEFLGMERPTINAKGGFGNSPLKIASVWGDVRAIEMLVQAGAQLDAHNEDGLTALHYAAQAGHLDAVRRLVELGAPVNAKDDEGLTALQLAKILNRSEVVAFLATHEA